MFDMYLALAFGVIGYVARKTGYHVAAILIGVILGPLLEKYFLIALQMSQGDIMVLFSSNLANVLWVALLLSIAVPYYMEYRRKRKGQRETPTGPDTQKLGEG
jgi:putative tricarboxylic transport membrane protein